MLIEHGKVFALTLDEIKYTDPSIVIPMVIFIVPHVLYDLKHIPMLRALLPELLELLKENVKMDILKTSLTSYFNR